MRIRKQLLDNLAAQGIHVQFWPEPISHADWLQAKIDRLIEETRERLTDEHSYFSLKDGTQVGASSSEQLKERYVDERVEDWMFYHRADSTAYYGDWYECTKCYIWYANREKVTSFTCKKSEEITFDTIIDKLMKNEKKYQSPYGDFAIKMQRLLIDAGMNMIASIYPTTYGIGVWVIFNYAFDKCVDFVTNLLKSKGIEYQNEYSDARWVFRFKISKQSANLARLNG